MLRAITLNLNGVRSAAAKGAFAWLARSRADVICVQELKAQECDLDAQIVKFRFMERFFPHLARLRACGREVLLCGDWNIAHREIDLKNWRANRKNSGFLPEERAWLTRVFDELGFVDVFRRLDPRPERYTWWSSRGEAWAKNVGWRGSTTRSRRRAWPRALAQRQSTRASVSPTMRR